MHELNPSGLIIAGGRSTRMGIDKALLPVDGRPLLAIVAERVGALCASVMIAVDDDRRAERYRTALAESVPDIQRKLQFLIDRYPGSGPLAGLEAGLSQLPEGYVFAVACDMPLISESLLRRMAEHADGKADVIHAKGQPFHALYHTRAAACARRMLGNGDFRFMRFLDQLNAIAVQPQDDAEAQAFMNLNTPESYARYLAQKNG